MSRFAIRTVPDFNDTAWDRTDVPNVVRVLRELADQIEDKPDTITGLSLSYTDLDASNVPVEVVIREVSNTSLSLMLSLSDAKQLAYSIIDQVKAMEAENA